MPSPLAISNIILSQSEHGGGGADATDGPKLASFRHALQPNPCPCCSMCAAVESLAQDYNAALAMVLALLVKPLSMLVAMVLPLALWLFATPNRDGPWRIALLGG
ncbi:hypothetical protein PINS_up015234 [Pythium insidiosum]|nr:hypothetical protein PINS_up015234 [Pythium insidiosum]